MMMRRRLIFICININEIDVGAIERCQIIRHDHLSKREAYTNERQ